MRPFAPAVWTLLVVASPTSGEQTPCKFEDGSVTRWCRVDARAAADGREHYRYCTRREPTDIACGDMFGPLPTVDIFRQTLAKKHVVFIGDSRVRYQYMNLVDALVRGNFMRCQDYPSNAALTEQDPRCLWINEKAESTYPHATWGQWYSESNRQFNDKASNSTEICDCYRSNKVFKPGSTYENRFFSQATPNGEIRISYFENFQDRVFFHEGYLPFGSNGHAPCDAGTEDCHTKPKYSLTITETLEKITKLLNATHIFASAGWKQLDIGCALARAEQANAGLRAYYITHTEKPPPELGCNATLFDRFSPSNPHPATWFWDKLHVLSILNQHYNMMLLRAIS